MNKKTFLTQLLTKKEVVDYTYATLFFLLSALFAVFAIRPSLSIAFSLKKEAAELKKINEAYEHNINAVIKIQSQLEQVRDKVYLLDEAAPSRIAIKNVIDNVQKTTTEQGIDLKEFNVPSVVLKGNKEKGIKTVPLTFELNSDYTALDAFVKALFLKRRLTVVNNLQIETDAQSSISATLNTKMSIENYYL